MSGRSYGRYLATVIGVLGPLNDEMMDLTWCLLLGEGKYGEGKMMEKICFIGYGGGRPTG